MGSIVLPLNDQMRNMRDWSRRRLPSGIEIPSIAVPVFELGNQVVPAYGAGNQVTLITHTVPANYEALFTGIVLGYAGAPPANPGDIVYSIDVDRPLGLLTAGYDEKDFGVIPIQMGSFVTGYLWPVEFKHESSEVIRVKAYSVANVGIGAPNTLLAALVGFEWPAKGAF